MQQGIFEASLLSELQLNEFAVAFSMLLKARNMRARCVLYNIAHGVYAGMRVVKPRVRVCYASCACARRKAVQKGHNLRKPVFNGSAYLGGFDLQIKY